MPKNRPELNVTELLLELDVVLHRTHKKVRAAGRAVESMETILRRARQVDYIMGKESNIEPFQ